MRINIKKSDEVVCHWASGTDACSVGVPNLQSFTVYASLVLGNAEY